MIIGILNITKEIEVILIKKYNRCGKIIKAP